MIEAVAFIFFNKIETTKQVFLRIREVKPKRIYLISDGPRNAIENEIVTELRQWVENQIDWNPNVKKIYSDRNMGCKARVVSGITEVFEYETRAIIIEDDVLPEVSFFEFCSELLVKYEQEEQIMAITGINFVEQDYDRELNGYDFSAHINIWGWATWKRVWDMYDSEMVEWPRYKEAKLLKKDNLLSNREIELWNRRFDSVYNKEIDTWDYQMVFLFLRMKGLCIYPFHNLIRNIGFGLTNATHTVGDVPDYCRKAFDRVSGIEFPLSHPSIIKDNRKHDIRETRIVNADAFFPKKQLNAMWRLYHKIKNCFLKQ